MTINYTLKTRSSESTLCSEFPSKCNVPKSVNITIYEMMITNTEHTPVRVSFNNGFKKSKTNSISVIPFANEAKISFTEDTFKQGIHMTVFRQKWISLKEMTDLHIDLQDLSTKESMHSFSIFDQQRQDIGFITLMMDFDY